MAGRIPKVTAQKLAKTIGVPVPSSFVRAMTLAHESMRNPAERAEFFATPWNWLLPQQLSALTPRAKHQDLRYACTPAEAFPFATMGVDGVHYGFVVHDPELSMTGTDSSDWPIAQISPMDVDPMCLYIGSSFNDALVRGMSQLKHLGLEPDDERRATVNANAMLASLKVPGRSKKYTARNLFVPKSKAVHVPAGWMLATSVDGLGVLAPSRHFRGKRILAYDPSPSADEQLVGIQRALDDGFFGTALVGLRNLWQFEWINHEVAPKIAEMLVITYRALGRDVLAHAVLTREKLRLLVSSK